MREAHVPPRLPDGTRIHVRSEHEPKSARASSRELSTTTVGSTGSRLPREIAWTPTATTTENSGSGTSRFSLSRSAEHDLTR